MVDRFVQGRDRGYTRRIEKIYYDVTGEWFKAGEYYRICQEPEFIEFCQKYCRPTSKSQKDMWLIAFNPPSDDIDLLVKAMHKLISSKMFYTAYYNFEQRSEERNNYYGFHSHGLVTSSEKSKQRIITRMLDLLNHPKLYNKTLERTSIHVRESDKGGLDYIYGIKTDDKQLKLDNDKRMRKKFHLEEVYCKGREEVDPDLLPTSSSYSPSETDLKE